MTRLSSLTEVERLYATHGAFNYGEDVTQMEHALQSAALAEAGGGEPSLIVAALLHDIGHLFEKEGEIFAHDDRHEIAGSRALAGLFDEAVRQPIALHVAAKRYLCLKEPQYFRVLSPASQRSLVLQGGPFNATEGAAFESQAHWREAVALRRFDDMGKRDDLLAGRAFADFLPLMHGLVIDR